jgi:hypothetical protein
VALPPQQVAYYNGLAQTVAATDAYVWARGLTVPLRSSIVRAMIGGGVRNAVQAGTRANAAVQTIAVDYAAIKSAILTSGDARDGSCSAAFPIF